MNIKFPLPFLFPAAIDLLVDFFTYCAFYFVFVSSLSLSYLLCVEKSFRVVASHMYESREIGVLFRDSFRFVLFLVLSFLSSVLLSSLIKTCNTYMCISLRQKPHTYIMYIIKQLYMCIMFCTHTYYYTITM